MKAKQLCQVVEGRLVEPRVHDALILGWVFDNVDAFAFLLKSESGDYFQLVIDGVTQFFATASSGPTIIFEILCGGVSEIPEDIVREFKDSSAAALVTARLERSEGYVYVGASYSSQFLISCSNAIPLISWGPWGGPNRGDIVKSK